MDEKTLQIIMQKTGCAKEIAASLFEELKPCVAEEVLQEPCYHTVCERVRNYSVKESVMKDGTAATTTVFTLASNKKITFFQKGERNQELSGLEGKRVLFIITKQKLGTFSNEIESSGRPASAEEIKELWEMLKKMLGESDGNKTQPETKPVVPSPSTAHHTASLPKEAFEVGKPVVAPKKVTQG